MRYTRKHKKTRHAKHRASAELGRVGGSICKSVETLSLASGTSHQHTGLVFPSFQLPVNDGTGHEPRHTLSAFEH